MIVIAPGIARNFSGGGSAEFTLPLDPVATAPGTDFMLMFGVVVQRHHDDGPRRRKEESRIGPLCRVALHPFHLAVEPTRQPLLQAIVFFGQTLRPRDSDPGKPEL